MRIAFLLTLLPLTATRAGVVINEVFYNAPDDPDDLQWIELHDPPDRGGGSSSRRKSCAPSNRAPPAPSCSSRRARRCFPP